MRKTAFSQAIALAFCEPKPYALPAMLPEKKLKRAAQLLKAERSQKFSIPAQTQMLRRQAAAFVAESEGLEGFTTTAQAVLKAGDEVSAK